MRLHSAQCTYKNPHIKAKISLFLFSFLLKGANKEIHFALLLLAKLLAGKSKIPSSQSRFSPDHVDYKTERKKSGNTDCNYNN